MEQTRVASKPHSRPRLKDRGMMRGPYSEHRFPFREELAVIGQPFNSAPYQTYLEDDHG